MDQIELKQRTKTFALRIMKLVEALPKKPAGWAIGKQLIRSGTSVGANYRAACRSRSRAEFIAKIGVVEEEADESAYWMELITEAALLKAVLVAPLRDEAEQIRKIMARSRLTAMHSNGGSRAPVANHKPKTTDPSQPRPQIANRKSQ